MNKMKIGWNYNKEKGFDEIKKVTKHLICKICKKPIYNFYCKFRSNYDTNKRGCDNLCLNCYSNGAKEHIKANLKNNRINKKDFKHFLNKYKAYLMIGEI